MKPAIYIASGIAVGLVIGLHLRAPTQARCCQQLETLVRQDLRKRCGALGELCEGAGGALGLFGQSSALLDAFGVT
jgi:hypothetical protein